MSSWEGNFSDLANERDIGVAVGPIRRISLGLYFQMGSNGFCIWDDDAHRSIYVEGKYTRTDTSETEDIDGEFVPHVIQSGPWNQSLRVGDIRGIVVHITNGGASTWEANLQGTMDWFSNPNSNASSHVVIDRNGTIYAGVPDEYCAWHAGVVDKSLPDWIPGNPNQRTLGVELVGQTDDPATEEQYRSLAWYIKTKAVSYGFVPDREHIIPHSLLYRQRANDPGPNFRWDKLGLV